MDAQLFWAMLQDKKVHDLKRLGYKYSTSVVAEFIALLKENMYTEIALKDFMGNNLVYTDSLIKVNMNAFKRLMTKNDAGFYGRQAMGEEIHATLSIESINSSRSSIREVIAGYAPRSDEEERIYGMKKGIDFIADRDNKITADSIYRLYRLAVDGFVAPTDRLLAGRYYRHDDVFVVGGKAEHRGLSHDRLSAYMDDLVEFINSESVMDDLCKAAIIHFYIGYLHPYFDGNGRMARLLHQWYLVQRGYSATLFVSFSECINKRRQEYYKAYTVIEKNTPLSGVVDVTPFIVYFNDNVYDKIIIKSDGMDNALFQEKLSEGMITVKEKELWHFVSANYGEKEFSTKQLEKDFGNAAYATIRGFVLKFSEMGLLASQQYGNRVRYKKVY